MSFEWSLPFLEPGSGQSSTKHALIILNQPLSLRLLQKLWNASEWRCCADGGANRLHDELATQEVSSADDVRTR
ncbi:hypothetical protein PHLCEN_2v7236 [Hermanssonia centrifuga]|uniref:Uncharacterized protein n=1 Tax=Hermanssonia centrifuga TaxID=98765 RepID=A0A2R6NX96_9APHY|nr:hypothetical protein PHLCEN_2v7236 [Hermanssonia centrifuga]